MNVIQTTTIELEENEVTALKSLRDAYRQCLSYGIMNCENCPLFIYEDCIGLFADRLIDKNHIK